MIDLRETRRKRLYDYIARGWVETPFVDEKMIRFLCADDVKQFNNFYELEQIQAFHEIYGRHLLRLLRGGFIEVRRELCSKPLHAAVTFLYKKGPVEYMTEHDYWNALDVTILSKQFLMYDQIKVTYLNSTWPGEHELFLHSSAEENLEGAVVDHLMGWLRIEE